MIKKLEALQNEVGISSTIGLACIAAHKKPNEYYTLAKSILDSEEIRYFIKGEMIRSIAVLNNIMEIQVPIEDAQKAKDLLKDLDIK